MNRSTFGDHHVTAVIAHLLKPGREKEYEAWMREIIPVAKTFPGHLEVNILRPQPGTHSEYVIVLHFDRHDHLQAWLDSSERRDLIARVQPLIQEREEIQVLTGLETWFELPKRPQRSPPKRYKMALLTWLAVFATLSVVGRILNPFLAALPSVIAQIITIGVVVGLLTYVIMPRLTQIFRRWLYPSH
jgi:uncharacterized protein